MPNAKGSIEMRSWRDIARMLVVTASLAVVARILNRGGAPESLVIAALFAIPIVVAFVPAAARRWDSWGRWLSLAGAFEWMSAITRPDEGVLASIGNLFGSLLAFGVVSVVAARIAGRSASAS